MKCEICKTEVPREKNSVVCSDKCQAVRLLLFKLMNKYFPTHGCDNCWSDLHAGCTEQCNKEFKEAREFGQDLWSIISLVFPHPKEEKEEVGG